MKTFTHGFNGAFLFYLASRVSTFIYYRFGFYFLFHQMWVSYEPGSILIQMLYNSLCYFPMYIIAGLLIGLFNARFSTSYRHTRKSFLAIGLICIALQAATWLLVLPLWASSGNQVAGFLTLAFGFPVGELFEPAFWLGQEQAIYFVWQALLTLLFFVLSSTVFVLGIFAGGKMLKRKDAGAPSFEAQESGIFGHMEDPKHD